MRMMTAGAGESSAGVRGGGEGGERPAPEVDEHPRPLSVSCVDELCLL